MKKMLFLLLCIGACIGVLKAQQHFAIHGYVRDAADGEPLIGTSVKNELTQQGVVTDPFGRYSLTQKGGKVKLVVSYVGYHSQIIEFNLTQDTLLNIALQDALTLGEVVVTAQSNPAGVGTPQLSAVTVPVDQIKRIPAIFGETDVIKALQLLPGVQGGTEGTSGIYVRGGGPDQNLIIMDGIPLYNVNHMMGLFSNFNPDAVKNVTLYKGSFPARFGGRLSSVIDVRMKDGNDKKIHGNVSVGLISSKFNVEGPIIKEKTTFNLSGRRTYLDLIGRPIAAYLQRKERNKGDGGYNFYDLNLKLSHKFSDRDQLFVTGYMGDDHLFARNTEYSSETKAKTGSFKLGWNWGNQVAAIRWNHVVNSKMFLNTTAFFNQYRSALDINNKNYGNEERIEDEIQANYNSGVRDLTFRSELSYQPNYMHDILAGAEYTWHTFRPDVTSLALKFQGKGLSPGDLTDLNKMLGGSKKIPAHEVGLFVEDNATITDDFKLNAGLRYTLYAVHGKTYHSVEPRLGMMYKLMDQLSVKAGYALMTQYIHLLSTNVVSLPTDLWVPATKKVSPMSSHQLTAGLYYHLPEVGDFSVEGYYKKMNNLIEYKDGAGFILQSKGWEDLVVSGDGKAYGVEFLYQRSFGNTTGWLGYTWSRSLRIFNRPDQELNGGKPFPAKYDRIHDFSIAVSHRFSDRFDVSATWVFSTGNAATLPMQDYYVISDVGINGFDKYEKVGHVSSRNNFRYPNYHRLDLSANYHKKHKYGSSTWNLSIYNAYMQMNPFVVIPYSDTENPQGAPAYEFQKLKKVTPFPIIPTISYTYSF